MSSTGIGATQLTLSAGSLNAAQSVGSVSLRSSSQGGAQAVDSDGDHDGGVGGAASTRISKQAQLYSQLQKLQREDPAKFKQVLTDAANQLQAAAQNATGDEQKSLTALAAKFTQAANGDLSALQPPAPPANGAAAAYAQNGSNGASPLTGAAHKGGHHHHHGGGDASQQAVASVFKTLSDALASASATATASASSASTTSTTA